MKINVSKNLSRIVFGESVQELITVAHHGIAKYEERKRRPFAPCVVLESTILTHGLPYPQNLDLLQMVNKVITDNGCTPITVGVLNGELRFGMTLEEIEQLVLCTTTSTVVSSISSLPTMKVSRRDLPFAVSEKRCGGTTVCGTLAIANMAEESLPFRLPIFATGGIGGVHRVSQTSNGLNPVVDISADLRELGRNPLAVLCAGVKSILDVENTLEYLETEGVCVATISSSWSQDCGDSHRHFPGFFSREAKSYRNQNKNVLKAPFSVPNIERAASLIENHRNIFPESNGGGLLLALPPSQKSSLDPDEIETLIQRSMKDTYQGMISNEATPALLKSIREMSDGATLTSNVSLMVRNADVASKIACIVSKNSGWCDEISSAAMSDEGSKIVAQRSQTPKFPSVVVVGGCNMDVISRLKSLNNSEANGQFKIGGETNDCEISCQSGGVGRNIADALARLHVNPKFISAVGDDCFGQKVLDSTSKLLEKSYIKVDPTLSTSVYILAIKQCGDVYLGMGDMSIHNSIDSELYESSNVMKAGHSNDVSSGARPFLVVFDGNIPTSTIETILKDCSSRQISTLFEPTDTRLCHKVLSLIMSNDEQHSDLQLSFVTPNMKELSKMARFLHFKSDSTDDTANVDLAISMCNHVFKHCNISNIVVSMGSEGCLVASKQTQMFRHYIPRHVLHSSIVECVSGAGDCFVAGLVAALARMTFQGQGYDESVELKKSDWDVAVSVGMQAAECSLRSLMPVPDELCYANIEWDGYDCFLVKNVTES